MYHDNSLYHRKQLPFMHACKCGIGSSPADHHHFHKHGGTTSSIPPAWLSRLHAATDKFHSSIPLAVSSIAIAGVSNLPTSIIPLGLSQPLLAGVFIALGVPAIAHSLLTGYGTRKSAIASLLDVHTLMTFSAFAALALGNGPEGAFLLGLFQLAHAVQNRMVEKARKDFANLADIVPDTAQVVDRATGIVSSTPAHQVPIASRVLVRPGTVCPIDGRLISAHCAVNVSHIPGESVGVEKIAGDVIPGGAVNTGISPFEIETVQTSHQSTLQRIISVAQSAAYSRPPIATMIDKIAPKYSLVVLGGTAAVAAAGPVILGWSISQSIYTALAFLVAASPCALLVSVPVAQAAAVSACSKRGIILSGGASALSRFATAESLALDKTGTITRGELRIVSFEPPSELHCLQIGAALAFSGSSHPASRAISSYHLPDKYKLLANSVVEIPGKSVCGTVIDRESKTTWTVVIEKADSSSHTTASSISITSDTGELHRCIVNLEDTIRANVGQSISNSPVPVYMLTGDNMPAATEVANKIGIPISRVYACMTPEKKVEQLKSFPRPVMVGDGINDAPALAAASAGGIAVASSADAESIQSASVAVADAVVIVDQETTRNPIDSAIFLIHKAKKTDAIIRSNIGIAVVGMTGTVFAVLSGQCPLWLAVLLHEGSTVLVVLNSLRNLS